MTKKEYEDKIGNIETKLKQIGDLDDLFNIVTSKNSKFQEIVQKASEQEENINQIPIKKEEFEKIFKELEISKDATEKNLEIIKDLENKNTESNKKLEEILELSREQLGIISNEKLSNSFDIRSVKLIEEKEEWFKRLLITTLVLVIAIIAVVIWQTAAGYSIFEISFLVKLALTSPVIFFEFFISKEYSRSQELLEEYQFKASVARSFEAYKEIIENSFSNKDETGDKGFEEKKLDFILETVRSLYISPMKNINENRENKISLKSVKTDLSNILSVLNKK